MPDMLTTSQVAEILGKSTRRITQLVKSGRLRPALKLEGIRGAYLFEPQAVDRFLAAEEEEIA
jgi:excisionase family DNA binding protein